MNRTRDYYRKMRMKHIRRKKRITSHYHAWDDYPYYKFDGMYSKIKFTVLVPCVNQKLGMVNIC